MKKEPRDKLFWWVGLAFALLIAAWSTFILVASRHRVAEVPLVNGGK